MTTAIDRLQVTEAILRFRSIIEGCWPRMLAAAGAADWDSDPYFLDRWLQANWEILVEQMILGSNGFLLPYGYSDDPLSRYGHQGKAATHRLICREKSTTYEKRYVFCAFVTKRGGRLEISAPFDYVDVRPPESTCTLSFPISDILFEVEELASDER